MQEQERRSKLTGAENMRDAADESMRRNSDLVRRDDRTVSREDAPDTASMLMKMVDFRIPLIWLLGGFIVGVTSIVALYYQVQALNTTIVRLEIAVATGNAQALSLAKDVAYLNFRAEQTEKELARLTAQGGK